MRSIDRWLAEYGESHRNPVNKLIHWICVPAIVFSLIGLLWALPVPRPMAAISPALNWALLAAMVAAAHYLVLSVPLGIGSALALAGMLLAAHGLAGLTTPLWAVSATIFVLA
jgi:uncharacterized membrane protein YGL010W